ncbi:hypothetical protein [Mycoplasmopsis columboralis]|uniref:Rho termination factor N-terminal domain-containing protein n=1 Tax=Mycoplasmopsis columboralis TaxID=171282 RepID=A0A449B7A1_9BACT|nr:hypothetical protein [Mycoplasmopsis columboralis]VEU76463.1 Uncharacterised protein [Mycoplasmopsis columboralis]
MFGIYDRSFRNINSISELWAKESKFRKFIILNGIAIFILFLVSATINILSIVYRTQIIDQFSQILVANGIKENLQAASNKAWQELFWSNIWPTAFLLATNIFFARSVYLSYKENNLMRLSTSNIAIGVSSIISFSWMTRLAVLGKIVTEVPFVPIFALMIAMLLFSLITVIFVSWHLFVIKGAFARAFRVEASQKFFEEFSKMNQQSESGSPFGYPFTGMNPQTFYENSKQATDNSQANTTQSKTPQELEKEQQINKLLQLKNSQLHKMAQILGIYGYDKLTKEELAEKIYVYTKQKNKDK